MIELLLLVQAITTAALAFYVVTLRRELYPALATAGPVEDVGFWIRSADVLVLVTPQFEASKTAIRLRWLTREELFLRHRFIVYDVPMHYTSRRFYKQWREWMQGSTKYDCWVKKPRGLARLYNKAIDVVCFKKEEEKPPKDVIILPSRMRKRGKRIIKVY